MDGLMVVTEGGECVGPCGGWGVRKDPAVLHTLAAGLLGQPRGPRLWFPHSSVGPPTPTTSKREWT